MPDLFILMIETGAHVISLIEIDLRRQDDKMTNDFQLDKWQKMLSSKN